MDKISIGWVWLNRTLNRIIDQVNQQKPLSSASIAVEESPNGTLLKVVGPKQSDQTSGGGGQQQQWPPGVGWQALKVIDTSSGTCVEKVIYYWGTAPGASAP